MRGCWAQDGARWTTGASVGQAGHVLAEDDRGVQCVPDQIQRRVARGANHPNYRPTGVVAGYSRNSAKRSSRPSTVAKNTSWICLVIGPRPPIAWPSTEAIGVTSAAVPHRNASSAK